MKKINSERKFYWMLIGGVIILCCGLQVYGICDRHKNVIKEKTSDKILVKDLRDNKERIIVFSKNNSSVADYLYPGDTVVIQNTSGLGTYAKNRVYDASHLVVDKDLIATRVKKQAFDSVRNAMLMENNINKR